MWHNSEIASLIYFYKVTNVSIELLQPVLTKSCSWIHSSSKAWEISFWCSVWVYHCSGIYNIVIIISAVMLEKFASLFFLNPPSFFRHYLTIKRFVKANKWKNFIISWYIIYPFRLLTQTFYSLWSRHYWWSAPPVGAK